MLQNMANCVVIFFWIILLSLFDYVFSLDLDQLTVPDGFTISRYIDEDAISSPRALAMVYYQNATIVYVGSKTDKIYALIDYDSDSINDKVYHIWSAENSAYKVRNLALDHNRNDLYISVVARSTYRCQDIHSKILSFTDDHHTLNETDCPLWFTGVWYTGQLSDFTLSIHSTFYVILSDSYRCHNSVRITIWFMTISMINCVWHLERTEIS